MKSKKRILVLAILAVIIPTAVFALILHGHSVDVLNPKGVIAEKQRELMLITLLLGVIIVVPVFVMTFLIAWRYRESNTKAVYTPNWDGNRLAETIWWGVPMILIVIVSVITWNSSHELDPYKKLSSPNKPVKVEVVALQWKWLFIYPEQHIATVNHVVFPEDTPVEFKITSDAPMNSFWIPQLGGQVYAMSGMSTQLSLMADDIGTYRGSSANISGKGFAGMTFEAKSVTKTDFDTWAAKAQESEAILSEAEYAVLAKPSENNSQASYLTVDDNLYANIIAKYMLPTGNDKDGSHLDHGVTE